MQAYHYTECGLDNVFIDGLEAVNDHADEPTITIPAIGLLHKVIAESIINRPFKITGKELRFLRTEMGLTQDGLARILKVTNITVSRWEREETAIKDTAEMLVRLMAAQELGLDKTMNVNEVSEKVTSSPKNANIRIDGRDPHRYQPLAA